MSESVRPQPSRLYRWMVLMFVSLAMFGNYYFYDALSPLADVLQRQLHFSDENIGLLNSFYSIAPILTVLIGGFPLVATAPRKPFSRLGLLAWVGPTVTVQ